MAYSLEKTSCDLAIGITTGETSANATITRQASQRPPSLLPCIWELPPSLAESSGTPDDHPWPWPAAPDGQSEVGVREGRNPPQPANVRGFPPPQVEKTGAALADTVTANTRGGCAKCQRVGADAPVDKPTIRHRRHGRSDSRTHSLPSLSLPAHSESVPFAAAVFVPPVRRFFYQYTCTCTTITSDGISWQMSAASGSLGIREGGGAKRR